MQANRLSLICSIIILFFKLPVVIVPFPQQRIGLGQVMVIDPVDCWDRTSTPRNASPNMASMGAFHVGVWSQAWQSEE